MYDKPKKKRKNEHRRKQRFLKYVILVSVVFFLIGTIAFVALGIVSNEFRFDYTVQYRGEDAKSAIEDHLATPLIPSASHFYFFYTSWQDYFLRLRFDILTEDRELFLQSIDHMCFQRPLTQSFGYSPTSEVDWYLAYEPTDNTDHLRGMPTCGDNPYWKIIIDQSSDEIWTIYMESWSI